MIELSLSASLRALLKTCEVIGCSYERTRDPKHSFAFIGGETKGIGRRPRTVVGGGAIRSVLPVTSVIAPHVSHSP